LLIQGSIEDKIRQLQLYKSKLAREVLGEEGFAQALTLDDFRYLLS
jgi:SNF2 family DNA or RNA helicase